MRDAPSNPASPAADFRRTNALRWGLIGLLLGLVLFACWVVPYRLRYSPGGSYYTFGYIGDEYLYADKLQPLVHGATPVNVYNGFGDRGIISQFFLEDALRFLLNAAGIPVVAFYWICRIVFPLALGALFYFLARVCIPQRQKVWRTQLQIAGALLAWIFIYFLYDRVTEFPPWQGFINRIPTNFEYPICVLLAAVTVAFVRKPGMKGAAAVALASVLLFYLRPFAAVPWAPAIIACMLTLVYQRAMSVKLGAAMFGLALAGVLPWFVIDRLNKRSAIYGEMVDRFFTPQHPYEVHSEWILFLSIAAVLAAAAALVEKRMRPFVGACAFGMAVLPFSLGLLPQRKELLSYDRYGTFYLIALSAALLLVVARFAGEWKGKASFKASSRMTAGLGAAGILCALIVGWTNYSLDLHKFGPYYNLKIEVQYVPAYEWIEKNTPPDALVIVGEGYDYGQWPKDPAEERRYEIELWGRQEDLFLIVARRRKLYCEHLRGDSVGNEELYALAMLHRGTLGFPAELPLYKKSLARYRPTHVLWRKLPAQPLTATAPPVPRGYGKFLKNMSRTVYEDAVCEIWELRY